MDSNEISMIYSSDLLINPEFQVRNRINKENVRFFAQAFGECIERR
jgi:hypothetical protein